MKIKKVDDKPMVIHTKEKAPLWKKWWGVSIIYRLKKCYRIVTLYLCLANTKRKRIRRTKLCVLTLIAVPSYLMQFAISFVSDANTFAPSNGQFNHFCHMYGD